MIELVNLHTTAIVATIIGVVISFSGQYSATDSVAIVISLLALFMTLVGQKLNAIEAMIRGSTDP